MAKPSFVHLHLHTEYSLLDGSVRIPDLMNKASSMGMPAVAMTDHGNLYGAVEFFQAAEKKGLKPIIGCELYVAPGSRLDKKATSAKETAYHLTVLCQTDTGYRNLVKLVSAAHLEGFYFKPRVDMELLAHYQEGLIALSGCQQSEVQILLAGNRVKEAQEVAAQYRDIFGRDRYFIELHDHGLDNQRQNNPQLVRLARELKLGLVAANDVHFLEKSHHEAHDVMICIGTGSMVHDEKRLHYSPELYFKSPEEMAALFHEIPEALENTLRIAESCTMRMDFGTSKYPAYDPPEGLSRENYLRKLCDQGLRDRYGERAQADAELRQRLDYELSVIEKTGFVSYFLIVWDFIHYARTQGIPVGPGRGSAAGSLIAYCLGITDLDPLRYGLIFERFLNPERISPPDIDVDFCMDRRGEVIDYVRKKYGERAVSQIVTFGTLGAKSVVRDVGRVLGWSYGDADRLAKLIPTDLNITLEQAQEKNSELQEAVEQEPATRQLWDYALVLEGLSRNTGIHAAGVVIGDRPLDEYIPLTRGKDNEVVTQYAMGPLTELGMLKMDFLGLKTLTVMEDAIRFIRKKVPSFSLSEIPLDDQSAFDILNRGETVGVFQVEGGGITGCCKRFDVRSIDDIIAILALYRPGPMQFIPDYIARKKGEQKVHYAHPLLAKVCADTFGIIVYQEQVQRAANVLAGYSLGQADLLRRAMGKKDKEKMAKERETFVAGCLKTNNIPSDQANAIFDFIAKFAEYGFNKSHSAAYGLISYQTAWLKAHYPVEFMAGLLSNDMDKTEKISGFIAECRRMRIPVLPPDVNESEIKFTPVEIGGQQAIRFGLAAVKNVGSAAMQAAFEERMKGGKFTSMADFCARLDSRTVNRKILENLVKAGAFDSLGQHRAALFSEIDFALGSAAQLHKDRMSGQTSLFDEGELSKPSLPASNSQISPWSQEETISYEKELLGFYVSGHPLDDYAGSLESSKFRAIVTLETLEENTTTWIGGLIQNIDKKFVKKSNKPFCVIILEDFSGSIELTAWDEIMTEYADFLQVGQAVALQVRVHLRDGGIRVNINRIEALKKRASKLPVQLRLRREGLTPSGLLELQKALKTHRGKRPVDFVLVSENGWEALLPGENHPGVGDEIAFRKQLAEACKEVLLPG